MATKKSAGSTSLGRESQSKRLGVKLFDGEPVKAGMIIVRQRGTSIRPGKNVKRGEDDTLYAGKNGVIKFQSKKMARYTGALRPVKIVHVIPA